MPFPFPAAFRCCGLLILVNSELTILKAAFITQTGPADCIQYGDLPDPIITAHQVLIKTSAVSVNPIDTYIRNGANYWPLPQPYIIGSDLAGTIVEIGSHVTGLAVGDRVWCSNQGLLGRQGTFSELCAVDAHWVYPTPHGVRDEEAAASALVSITAHLGLLREAKLRHGETIFVRGGAGGVGSMVLQMAKAIGATVITTAGGDKKVATCKQLGADHVIDYQRHDVKEQVLKLIPSGVNVFWETLREPDFELAVATMSERGRMILMAGRDARPAFPVGPFYVKGCSLHGFVMFKATPEEQRSCAADINHWLGAGKIRPLIDRVLPLSEAAEAHRLQESHTVQKRSNLVGKLVLRPDV